MYNNDTLLNKKSKCYQYYIDKQFDDTIIINIQLYSGLIGLKVTGFIPESKINETQVNETISSQEIIILKPDDLQKYKKAIKKLKRAQRNPQKQQKLQRKVKKNIPEGNAHINATFNIYII